MSREVQIVIVDDDEVDREAISRAISNARFTNPVHCVNDAYAALELLSGTDSKPALEKPYLILLDMKMPGIDGLEFLIELRADPQLCSTPVLVISTSDAEQDRIKAYGINIAGYITKAQAAKDFSILGELLERAADWSRDAQRAL